MIESSYTRETAPDGYVSTKVNQTIDAALDRLDILLKVQKQAVQTKILVSWSLCNNNPDSWGSNRKVFMQHKTISIATLTARQATLRSHLNFPIDKGVNRHQKMTISLSVMSSITCHGDALTTITRRSLC